MKTTNPAANLLNVISLLTIVIEAEDRQDAEEQAAFWWLMDQDGRLHLPDGRVLRFW